jgi:hypothetical protein
MWNYFQQQVYKLGDELERLKGARVYKHQLLTDKAHYEVHVSRGFNFKIHCDDVLFVCEYKNKLWTNECWPAFRVRCEFSNEVPVFYQDRMKDVKFLPCIGSRFTSKEFKRKTAVKVYLDTVLTV